MNVCEPLWLDTQDTTNPAGFVTPPSDMDKFAEVAGHVALHYNNGWANGFHFNIRYWEVWNEADLQPFWRDGTAEQYHELYAKTAQALKSHDASLKVGGPAIATHSDLMAKDGWFQISLLRYLH